MKHDFEGFSVRAQAYSPDEAGAETNLLSLTFGQNFGDEDRGNFAIAVEHSMEERLYGRERDFNGDLPGLSSYFVRNPGDTADPPQGDGDLDDPAIPDNIPLERVGWGDTSRCGALFVNFVNWPSPDYNCDASPWDFGTLPPQTIGGFADFPISPYNQQGGSATKFDDYLAGSTVLPEIERTNVNLFLNLELGESLEFFTEIKWAQTDVVNYSSPSFDFYLFMDQANPFIPAALLPEIDPAEGGLYMSRDNIDLGFRGNDVERETQRAVFGLRGELGSSIDYEVSLTYGKTDVRARQLNNRLQDRFFAALDVIDNSGTPDCRVNVNAADTPFDFPDPISYDPTAGDCVPLNLFGEGVASPEAVAWVMGTTLAIDEIEQTVLSGYLTGDLDGFSLPGGAVSWAAGAEYREESSRFTPDPLDAAGATFGNVLQDNYGEFDVNEVFGELSFPVLAGSKLAEELTFEVAYRYSDYSTVGNTGTWKLGGIWSPIPDILIRGTVSEAVRAPNIGEAYAADGETFEPIFDPCDVSNLSLGTQYRASNCASILNGFGVDPLTFVDPNSSFVGGILGGNPNVREETANTDTLGLVFFPRFAENLSIAIDYYNIDLTDAITTVDPQEFAERCVDAPSLDNEFCPRIERNETTGAIDSFSVAPINIASLETSGVDLTLNYALTPSRSSEVGSFNFRLIANRLNKLKFLPSPGGVIDDDVGEGPSASFSGQPSPEWQATFDLGWNRGPLTVNYGFQWFNKTQRISNRSLNGDSDLPGGNRDTFAAAYYYYDAKLVHDIHVNFETSRGLSVFGGIRNLTDEKPAFDRIFYPVSPVGRSYYLGVEANLF
jgi:outer membrane receptor protein involved in Fe transport